MKLIQYKGPFTAGDVITIPAEYDTTYVHIGIQIPNRQPIAYYHNPEDTSEAYPYSADIELGEADGGTIGYAVNEKGILEFDELAQNSWRIRFLKDVPMETIIDILYSEEEI